MIKLVVSDLDGTLIDRDEALSDRAVAMTERLKERGVLFTIATGRVESMADSYVRRLNIDIPYIASNGATIIHGSRIVQRNRIPIGGLRDLLLTADGMGMSVIYTIEGIEFVLRTTPWIAAQRERFNRYHSESFIADDDWHTLLIDKVTVMDDIRDGRIGSIDELCRGLPELYCSTRYTDKAIEIVDRGSNKGTALQSVAAMLGIGTHEIMAIGDHQNDVEMLALAGVGVAVANGTEAAKAAADYVCGSCCIEGVLEAVDKFCFAGKGAAQ